MHSLSSKELESAISDFAAQTKKDAKERRALTSLTYEDIYWAGKIENPLVGAPVQTCTFG